MTWIDQLVERFLAWPLPDSVCADLCATKQGAPHRSGTTLLSFTEAKQMFEHVLAGTEVAELREQLDKRESEAQELRFKHRHCETEIATANAEKERVAGLLKTLDATKNLGEVKTGDVLLIRYLKDTPPEERKLDYAAVRNYFASTGVHPRIIGLGDNLDIEHLSEVEMASYGWFKRRK